MEEADLRLAEIKKESYEFERDITKGAVNSRTGKVVAEKVIRYFEDKLRSRVRCCGFSGGLFSTTKDLKCKCKPSILRTFPSPYNFL